MIDPQPTPLQFLSFPVIFPPFHHAFPMVFGRLAAPASAPRLLVALLAQGVAPAEGHQLLEDEANGLAKIRWDLSIMIL